MIFYHVKDNYLKSGRQKLPESHVENLVLILKFRAILRHVALAHWIRPHCPPFFIAKSVMLTQPINITAVCFPFFSGQQSHRFLKPGIHLLNSPFSLFTLSIYTSKINPKAKVIIKKTIATQDFLLLWKFICGILLSGHELEGRE